MIAETQCVAKLALPRGACLLFALLIGLRLGTVSAFAVFLCAARRASDESKRALVERVSAFIFDCDGACAGWPHTPLSSSKWRA